MTTTRYTISDIRSANKAAGRFFFEPATMRFFNSRIFRSVYQGPGGVYFVTSEQFVASNGVASPREYNIRRFHPETGDIDNKVGKSFGDLDEARDEARRLARGE